MSAVKLGALALFFAGALAGPKECPADSELSCSTENPGDTCCFNHPGGLVLLTEFWDSEPATGPKESWTIHGLWYVIYLSISYISIYM